MSSLGYGCRDIWASRSINRVLGAWRTVIPSVDGWSWWPDGMGFFGTRALAARPLTSVFGLLPMLTAARSRAPRRMASGSRTMTEFGVPKGPVLRPSLGLPGAGRGCRVIGSVPLGLRRARPRADCSGSLFKIESIRASRSCNDPDAGAARHWDQRV